jgi:uncharacterized protein with HEPN domain
MNEQDKVRLRHMLEMAQAAQTLIIGETRQTLDADLKLKLALPRAIEIIGEAASKISTEAQAATPQIPWPAIISMRNWIVHAYFEIDLDQVWDTVTKDLPPLISELEKMLSPEDKT